MDTPLVSIIVATYNRERYIAEAISSAQAQTYPNWELIVMDDGSSDNTDDVVEKIADKDARVRYVRQPKNAGIARNRNAGLEEARGELIAMLDSDDRWTDPDKLKKQVAFLQANPDHVMVGTFVRVMDEKGLLGASVEYETSDAGIRSHILLRNQFAQSSLLYRAADIRSIGGYDPKYTVNDDYDLWLKLGLKHKFANLPEYTADYRVHSGGITTEKKLLAADEHIRIIREYRHEYPYYFKAMIKGYARIVLAILGL